MPRVRVRDAVAVQGLFLLFGFTIAAFFPFLAIYLEGAHGLSESQIGLVIATMALARLVANPIWGHVADSTLGRLATLQIGAAGTALAAFAMNLVDGTGALAIAAFFQAAFMVTTGPNVDAIALVHLGDERMSEYGRIRGWESLTYAGGCLAFGAILQTAGVSWAMPLYALSSIAVLLWATLTVGRDRPAHRETHGRLGTVGAVFRTAPRFWGFLAATLLVWTGFNAAWNFISLRITDEGGGPLLIGFGAALGGLVEVFAMRRASRWQQRWGLRWVFVIGCVIYASGFLLWGAISDPTVLSVLTIFEGFAFSLLFTTGVVIVGKLLPDTLYSTGSSLVMMTGLGIGPILGAGIGGFVYERLGPGVLYAGASALAFASAVVAWFALSVPALSEPLAHEPATIERDPGPLI